MPSSGVNGMEMSSEHILNGACQRPKVHFKPLICLWEHKKFVTEEKMKPWSTNNFGHAVFKQAFSLVHSAGSLVWWMRRIADRRRWCMRATDHAGGRAEVTASLPWSLVRGSFCGLWLASIFMNIYCVSRSFPCKWLWMCFGCSLFSWIVLLASHWEHFCALHIVIWERSTYLCQSLAK